MILCPGDENGILPTSLFAKVVQRKKGKNIATAAKRQKFIGRKDAMGSWRRVFVRKIGKALLILWIIILDNWGYLGRSNFPITYQIIEFDFMSSRYQTYIIFGLLERLNWSILMASQSNLFNFSFYSNGQTGIVVAEFCNFAIRHLAPWTQSHVHVLMSQQSPNFNLKWVRSTVSQI